MAVSPAFRAPPLGPATTSNAQTWLWKYRPYHQKGDDGLVAGLHAILFEGRTLDQVIEAISRAANTGKIGSQEKRRR